VSDSRALLGRLVLPVVVLLSGCSTIIEPAGQSPGPITFGLALNERTLEVEQPSTSFRLGDEVAWSASLRAPVEGTKVNIVISESGGGSWLFGYEQFITDPGSTRLVNHMTLGRFLPEPGSYVMRYVTLAGDVVAEGEFELTP